MPLHAEPHCGFGFVHRNGKLQRTKYGTKLKTGLKANHRHDCRNLCVNEPGCCSFEFSDKLKNCNLNPDCEPTARKLIDYEFCTKVKGIP